MYAYTILPYKQTHAHMHACTRTHINTQIQVHKHSHTNKYILYPIYKNVTVVIKKLYIYYKCKTIYHLKESSIRLLWIIAHIEYIRLRRGQYSSESYGRVDTAHNVVESQDKILNSFNVLQLKVLVISEA